MGRSSAFRFEVSVYRYQGAEKTMMNKYHEIPLIPDMERSE
jgi:hypothetical protein